MATIICKVCGDLLTKAGQCKCQSLSEIPLPKQTTPLSTDCAIREGEPPYHPVSPNQEDPKKPLTPDEKMWIMIRSTLVCTVVAMLGTAIYGGIEYSKETAPIPPTEWVMLGWAICCGAPIGLVAGFIVGGLFIKFRIGE